MNKTLKFAMTALAGGLAGAVLVWIATRSAAPTNIFITLRSPAGAKADQGQASIPVRPAAMPHTSRVASAAQPRTLVRIENAVPTKPAPTVAPSEVPLARNLPATTNPARAVGNSSVAIQQIALPPRSAGVPYQPFPAITAVSDRLSSSALDDALSYALEAADPYEKEGFVVREDFWGGDLATKTTKAIVHQLFKGNEYWFWLGSDTRDAELSVHIYDREGRVVEAENWQEGNMAAARVIPKRTGEYYLLVEVEKSPLERTPWAMAYGFR